MTDSDQSERSIEDLIGPSSSAENPIDQVRQSLGEQEWQALLEGPLDLPEETGPVLLFLTPESQEAAELVEWLGDRATILPLNQLRKPTATSMREFCALIIRESFLPIEGGLDQFAEGIPVAILRDEGEPGYEGNQWNLLRPVTQLKNAEIIESLLLGEHPPRTEQRHEETALRRLPEAEQSVSSPGDAPPDTIAAIRALLEARKSGESTIQAFRKWVIEDPAFLGWVELKNGRDGIEIKVGGKEPGSVLRSVGDEVDIGEPIPTTIGSLGPFIGFPISDSWLGFLARNAADGRREFWKAYGLVPLIEQLVPSVAVDGSSLIEDPQDRFCRLLAARLKSAERRGGLPGVLALEFPGESEEMIGAVRGLLRGSDWMEVAGQRLWVLLDQPEQGAVESLTRRLNEALPGLRGGGTIKASSGVTAQQCMERVLELLDGSDQLRIEESGF